MHTLTSHFGSSIKYRTIIENIHFWFVEGAFFFLKCFLPPSPGRCWWCCHSWRETPASPSPTAWLTAKQPRPLSETGPPPRLPTVRSSAQILMACTGLGHYDHRLLSPTQTLPFCQTTGNLSAALRHRRIQPSPAVLHLLHFSTALAGQGSLAKRMCHVRMKQGKSSSLPLIFLYRCCIWRRYCPPPHPMCLETYRSLGLVP